MQRRSTKSSHVAHQLPLIATRPIVSRPVSLEHIVHLRNTNAALEYACQLADVERKEICLDMGYEKTAWSRICSGEFDLDGREIPKLNKLLGNSAYLQYLCFVDGWDLATMRKRLDCQQQKIEDLEKRLAESDREKRLLAGLLTGRP